MAEFVVETSHGKPAEGMECMCCMDDIDETNYVEYRTAEGNQWLPSSFCEACIATLLERQWAIYEDSLGKATCKAQQKRMLREGPPTHVYDNKALPCPEGESVHTLWYIRDAEVHSALLEGAPQGKARQIWWDEKLAFQFDEDEGEAEASTKSATTESTEPIITEAADMEVADPSAEAIEVAAGTPSASMEVESTVAVKTAAPPEADDNSAEVTDVVIEGVDTIAAAIDKTTTVAAAESASSKANNLNETSTTPTSGISAETSAEVP